MQGTGSRTTATIAVPANWEVDYFFDCTVAGSFSITVTRSGGAVDTLVSQTGMSGSDSVPQVNRRGSVSLQISTACSWYVLVVAA